MGKTSTTKTIYVAGGGKDWVVEDLNRNEWTAPSEEGARRVSRRQARISGHYGSWKICRVTIEELPAEEIPTPVPAKEHGR